MQPTIQQIIENNHRWADELTAKDPSYFPNLAKGQSPRYLFIGCSDSRVSADLLTQTKPGEMFVHRNIANQVIPADLNLLSVLQYAVEVLDVKHVIVCGHLGCGGVNAAMTDDSFGLVDHWLAGVRETRRRHNDELMAIADHGTRANRLVELNVLRQVHQLARTPIVQEAWKRGSRPLLHGLVYDIKDGLLRELVLSIDSAEKVRAVLEAGRKGAGY